jgi:phenylacetate-CoA ligase
MGYQPDYCPRPVANEPAGQAAQFHRLGEILPRWLSEVPLYRRANREVSPQARRTFDLDAFRRLPFITKSDLRRDFPRNFLPDGVELETLLDLDLVELEQTSGTSGVRIPLLLGRGWWAAQENRALRLNRHVARVLDEFPEARRVTLISPVCSGDICYTGVPSASERVVDRSLFVNLSRHPFFWSETDLARMAAEASAWQPQFLDVDPVYGVLFARYCERRRIRLPSLQFVLCSYEYLSDVHRRLLKRAFGVPVFNLYGSTETGHLLMENERGQMAPSLETAYLELVEPDHDGLGELVVTTLTNDYMPLIRYRIGDLVGRQDHGDETRLVVHGRVADAFTARGGARVTTRQVDECFAGLPGFAHYQLLEPAVHRWRLRFVADATPPRPIDLEELRRRLGRLLEATGAVEVQETDSLLAEGSGKFRLGYPARSVNPALSSPD